MAYIKSLSGLPRYTVTYIANGTAITKRIKKGDDCIANAPSVSKPNSTFRGWRLDNQPIDSPIAYYACMGNGIVLYAIWISSVTHGGTITAGAGNWGYDTHPDGSGYNWSTGAGGDCDGRCGIANCGVYHYNVWGGSGYNTPNGDGTYTAHPGYHGPLSSSWTENVDTIVVG